LLILIVVGVVVLTAAYIGVVIAANTMSHVYATALPVPQLGGQKAATARFSICTWNLGYAGLGEESDFAIDGGKMFLPPSLAAVRKNLQGIVSSLERIPADIYLFQEVANPGLLTRGVDVRSGVEQKMTGFVHSFVTDTLTRLVPPPIRVHHGTEIFSRFRIDAARLEPLPGESSAFYGVLKKSYGINIVELTDDTGAAWSLMNIHLAAFDENATARKEQMRVVFAQAKKAFALGRHVVVGGDWNLMLARTDFPNTTDPKYLFWLFDFPHEEVPADWRIIFDSETPSVRTNNQPYKQGENYTAVIDGFLVSPNVDVHSVHTTNLDFRFTDHQPVKLEVSSRKV
jgi:endonuclease/exonuclease/phosphatase family metal-dependent hydrolase